MSIITMLGFECSQRSAIELDQIVSECRFVPVSSAAICDPVAVPARNFAKNVDEHMSWWVGVEGDSIDLDRIYDISAQIGAHVFDEICSRVAERSDVCRMAFLFFDLGNEELVSEQLADPFELLDWIRKRMETGGPPSSLFAWANNP